MIKLENTKTQKWILLAYFVLCFYYFGTIMMTYFVSYPQLHKVSKNIANYMQLFNDKMILVCYFPAVLMIISHLFLLLFCSKKFSRAMLWLSFGLALFSVLTTFLVIVPVHNELPTLGLTTELNSKLLMYSMYFQIIPAAIQVTIAILLFNKFLIDTNVIRRVLFIFTFFLSLYALGALYIESLVGYPMWLLIDPSDWLATREAVGLNIPAFIWVFLIPVYLPLFTLIPMLWKHPFGISKITVLIMFFSKLWVFVITATYFVPDIQAKLTLEYSRVLIENLNKYDFPLRGIKINQRNYFKKTAL
ncbi:hypothetical protein [uncultured Flavobacterium sp.]|uniref:hypothetical protein n=1 Tax=uncultured Flavobacterium sp. TaxID=165435 RepID=UPI002931E211|nr:hypothetical protein [uncultured Flavobacterium sp.]